MTSYAAQKGRAAPVAKAAAPPQVRPLTQAEAARVDGHKRFVLEHMPELLPVIREFHAEGLIEGWRSVVRCALLDGIRHE